jgi:hypothetical protein
VRQSLFRLAVGFVLLGMVVGCSRLRPKPAAVYVYVSAKQTFLRDRVAAVSNRTAIVANGDRLLVLDHGRRFVKVQTEKGAQGWIDERGIATQEVFDGFDKLKQQHKDDPAVASGATQDESYLHVSPGMNTDRFYLLPEGEKVKLLSRATLLKPLRPGTKVVPPVAKPGAVEEPAPPPPMDDWWLVRDSHGDVGWMLRRFIEVEEPESLTRYSEGQRIVSAYVLTTVNDPDADHADKNIPIYVTVTSPYKAGLPYDFDQVRVFTWSVKKHRYETAFRDRNIEGYLPVTISMAKDPYGKSPLAATAVPTFSYRVLAAEAPPVVPDPVTGAIVPAKTVKKTYRLESTLVRRLLQPGMPAPMEAHPEPVSDKKKAAAAKLKVKKRR